MVIPMRRRDFLALVGALVVRPAASAQHKAMPVIGYLNGTSPGGNAPFLAAFRQGLGQTGYVEGREVAIEYRWAESRYEQLPALAADLIGRKVDLIATSGGDASARAAKTASSTIPIVSVIGGDPVAEGLVASLARPAGNLTGIAFLTVELMPKRLELLCELVPRARLIALLVNPNSPQTERVIGEMQKAARVKGMQLQILRAGSESEIETVFAGLVELRADGLVVQADPFFNAQREQLATLAARHAVPAIYEWRGVPVAGGLISYGTSLTGVYRQVGIYAGKVLKGEKPADLPVQQPTTFELVINLKTAKDLGLTVPPLLLAEASEVIE